MAQVFDRVDKTKQNIWKHNEHLPKTVNLTFNIGQLIPIDAQVCRAGMSYSYGRDTSFGFRFMTTSFPVQNSLKASLQFFKVPLRALYSGYKDRISGDEDAVFPFLDLKKCRTVTPDNFLRKFGNGSLFDYFNGPTTYFPASSLSTFTVAQPVGSRRVEGYTTSSAGIWTRPSTCFATLPADYGCIYVDQQSAGKMTFSPGSYTLDFTVVIPGTGRDYGISWQDLFDSLSVSLVGLTPSGAIKSITGAVKLPKSALMVMTARGRQYSFSSKVTFTGSSTDFRYVGTMLRCDIASLFACTPPSGVPSTIAGVAADVLNLIEVTATGASTTDSYGYSLCPWTGGGAVPSGETGIKLNTWLWRAYQTIYNSWYRNIRNNPLYINGKPKYNTFCTNIDQGGADLSDATDPEFFDIRYHNWEHDFLTTAVQNPMQPYDPAHPERVPLVGLTTYTDGKNLTPYLTDEDGKTYRAKFEHDDLGRVSEIRFEAGQPEPGQTVLRTSYATAAALSGIAISDFRDVNCLTRYLSFNNRRGRSYKDLTEGRFDTKVRYDELLMAEFCGGISSPVKLDPITQTTPSTTEGLYSGSFGSQAGNMVCFGKGDNSINIYCDEDSVVMGVLCVMPKPVYTQCLNPAFQYDDPLDGWTPEFDNLDLQPIKYDHAFPIQAYNLGRKESGVFGYQRPWYQYFENYDEAHGEFRDRASNFLMNRTFNGLPALTKPFLIIDPNQVNDVFEVREFSDKIFGQVYLDKSFKSGINPNVVPKLE